MEIRLTPTASKTIIRGFKFEPLNHQLFHSVGNFKILAAAAAVAVSLTIKKRKMKPKMIVLLLGAPIQSPKMIAALKMKSLVFFSSVLFSKLRSEQKYAMLTAQSSSCIKHVRERSSNLLKVHTPH